MAALTLYGFFRMTLGEKPQSPVSPPLEPDISHSEPTPKIKKETPPSAETPVVETSVKPETGIELLESLGFRDKVVYLVYGRPYGWGSLGLTQTPEGAWAFFHTRKKTISQKIGLNEQDFALNIINPAYYSQEHEAYHALSDDYVSETLRLAPENQGLVALSFNRLEYARNVISHLETFLSKEQLAHLALSFDAEHFPYSQVDARALNRFVPWFAQKHQEWAEGKSIPCLVFVYVFPGSRILNMQELKQYYLNKNALVVPIFDGWGLKAEKLRSMAGYIGTLPDTEASPALLGVIGGLICLN
ncbi:hypothetical protein AMJ51_00225 [Microgenomates bacterium DG_75]|nr:MAG: hypothetical protein AMJ51_00225 [Microgenomates bacterium DG_75]